MNPWQKKGSDTEDPLPGVQTCGEEYTLKYSVYKKHTVGMHDVEV